MDAPRDVAEWFAIFHECIVCIINAKGLIGKSLCERNKMITKKKFKNTPMKCCVSEAVPCVLLVDNFHILLLKVEHLKLHNANNSY